MFALASGESLNKGGNLLSLTPDVSVPGEIVDVRVQIGGERTPLLKTGKLMADWPIMYYLAKPLTITPRAVVEVETGTVHVEFALER